LDSFSFPTIDELLFFFLLRRHWSVSFFFPSWQLCLIPVGIWLSFFFLFPPASGDFLHSAMSSPPHRGGLGGKFPSLFSERTFFPLFFPPHSTRKPPYFFAGEGFFLPVIYVCIRSFDDVSFSSSSLVCNKNVSQRGIGLSPSPFPSEPEAIKELFCSAKCPFSSSVED